MTEHQHEKSCAPDIGGYRIGDQRQHYFEGKYMTARDFRDEQHYHVSHRHAHNRLLHGWGVVCGLRVDGLERVGCWDRFIRVNSGYALDCYGRELVVETDFCDELPGQKQVERWKRAGLEQQLGIQLSPFPERRPTDPKGTMTAAAASSVSIKDYLICLAYDAVEIEQVAALLDGECEPVHMEYNRIRETIRVIVVKREDMPSDCWIVRRDRPVAPCRDDCDDDAPGPAGTCIEPDCVCGQVVPLALVRASVDADGYLVRNFRLLNKQQAQTLASGATVTIEQDGCRRLPAPPSFLTHIVGINWPHGGQVTLEYIKKHMHGRLEITFDRRILPADGLKTGISYQTMIATYGGAQEDEELVPFDYKHQPCLEGDSVAVFTINPDYLDRHHPSHNLDNNIVRIRLLCDFILDCHENAVDGNHLGGRMPTGNGVQGGTFESWFMIGDPISELEEGQEGEEVS